MATSNVTPSDTMNKQNGFPGNANERVQRSILNDKFEKVTVVRPVDVTIADGVESVDDALSILDGNNDKLIDIIKKGLVSEAKRTAGEATDNWFDKETEEPYSGAQLDQDKANALVLGLAKSSFSSVYKVDPTRAKDKAREFLQSSGGAPLLAGLVVTKESESE